MNNSIMMFNHIINKKMKPNFIIFSLYLKIVVLFIFFNIKMSNVKIECRVENDYTEIDATQIHYFEVDFHRYNFFKNY